MANRGRYRFTLALGLVLVVTFIGYLALAGPEGTSTTNPDKALVHRNLLDNPYVPRLTLTATRANYDRDLFATVEACVQVFYQASYNPSDSAPLQQVSITLDRWWRRIIHTQKFSLVKAWGDSDSDPRKNLRIPLAMVANTGYWILHDNYIDLFIAETGPPRILRAWYDFGAQNMGFGDSLSVATDSLNFPRDLDLNDNGTPGFVYDDTLWVLDDRPAASRLVGYLPYWYAPAKTGSIDIPYGSGPGQINFLRNFAMGRDLSGANTKEVYVTDGCGKIVQYRISGGVLIYENEYLIGWSGGQRQEIVDPLDIAVDSYGHVYVAVQGPSSRIYKFTPDLELLHIFTREGKGPDEIWSPTCLFNSRPTVNYAGFDNLLVTENWSTETGGQRYAIGIKDSLVSRVYAPHSSDLTYHATDPHGLTLKVDRWSGSAWLPFATDSIGFKWSGATQVHWDLPTSGWGYDRGYRFRYVTTSTYGPPPGQPGVPFADTVEFTVTLGNEKPRIVALEVGGLEGGCIAKTFVHPAFVSAQDDVLPLTYTWRDLTDQAQFYDSSTQAWVSLLTGPWSSVRLRLPSGVGALEAAPPYVDLKVVVTDFNDDWVSMTRRYGTCDPDNGTCNCLPPCDCPHQGDINGDFTIDLFDVIAAIGIAYSGEPDVADPSCPTSRTDANNDGAADVFDVIYLIGTAFSGGDNPCNPCTPGIPAGCP